jgi:hypothetical protein
MIFKYARDYIAAVMSVCPSVRPSEITLNPLKKKSSFFHKKSEKIFFMKYSVKVITVGARDSKKFYKLKKKYY